MRRQAAMPAALFWSTPEAISGAMKRALTGDVQMTKHPERPHGPQESDGNEASAEERAPQSLAEADPSKRTSPQSPQEKQEFYWRRQAEKLEKELAAARAEREAEVSQAMRERAEATSRALEAEWRAERLDLFARSGLPSELLALVPEGDPELVTS